MTNKIQTARLSRLGFDRNSPLGRFWRWWSGELLALIPDRLRQTAGSVGKTLLIEINAREIVLWRRELEKLNEQGRLDIRTGDRATHGIAFQALVAKLRKRDDRIALWLSADQCLVKQIELPLATAENLGQVLTFEMDRHTPFKAEQVYFDFRIVRRDGQNNRISVKMAAAPRTVVDAALDQLTRWNFPAEAVYAANTIVVGEEPLNLIPAVRKIEKLTFFRVINLALLVAAIGLALAAIVIPIWQKRQMVIGMMPAVEYAKLQAASTEKLRREWEKKSSEFNLVLEKKQSIPPLVLQLDELSRLLPDDTWVQQFDLKGKELQIQGETASSSKLIALVETAKMLSDASFRSPLTKGIAANSERFHLAVVVKPMSSIAPSQNGAAPATAAAAAPAAVAVAASVPVPPPQAAAKAEPAKPDRLPIAAAPLPAPLPVQASKPPPVSQPNPASKPNLIPAASSAPLPPTAANGRPQAATERTSDKAVIKVAPIREGKP